ncbi:MAG TPA: hypothetical protein VGJ70_07435 [Solirubrobacteraceae bacterium]
MTRAVVTTVAVLAALAPPAAAAVPRADQMVVFRSGKARVSHPSLAQATAKVGGRRCAVAAGTPLAALLHSGVGPLSLRDFGSCSKRPADGGSLFVSAIGPDRNKGSDGWVYKVGNVLGTAGAADPAGPFGRGRLRAGARITWFWCHVTKRDRGCPHTLTVVQLPADRGTLSVYVRQYDDHGKAAPAAGAVVHAGGKTATADSGGVARLALAGGHYSAFAEQAGRVRSFAKAVAVG